MKKLKPGGIRINCRRCWNYIVANSGDDVGKMTKGWRIMQGGQGFGPYCPKCVKKHNKSNE